MGATASSSLGETMTLVGDHIVINYATEFEGAELNEITKKMRKIKPKKLKKKMKDSRKMMKIKRKSKMTKTWRRSVMNFSR